ncbi:helix-turn-helix domain-containing protein [Rhodococcus sp. 14-2483-1-2]|uniref:PucR family transcriptional regulator n=1 Tax=Rhodococcus sp. 14-2483-1-2 TaxID=2023147 RepID=UPI000B9B9D5B|nr:helix-turn-helix domain-containing protein [Rhodococcus sp. 14-2483-1-2]OZF37364.1 hypothetical protein CH295_06800 [Rhodococcus sp. 14-2483-1-2]
MPWERPPERIRDLIRQGAELIVHHESAWLDAFTAGLMQSPGMEATLIDPVLATETERAARTTVVRWAMSNITDPGAPVVPALDADIVEISRDLVRRGLDELALASYRIGQTASWTLLVRVAFSLTSEPEELEVLLDVLAQSIAEYIEGTLVLVAERVRIDREELHRGTHPQRRETLALLLEGAPFPIDRAEMRLGYSLRRTHTAVVAWSTEPGTELGHLERAVALLVERAHSAAAFTIVPAAATLWAWVPGDTKIDARDLLDPIDAASDVRIAIGSPAHGPEGFRRSHTEALLTQQMLSRSPYGQRAATYDEVKLATAMIPDRSDLFVRETLGGLVDAEAALRHTVLTFVRELGSVSRAAESLHAHRNTIVRRLAHADTLLPRPLSENPVHVAVALELAHWHGAGDTAQHRLRGPSAAQK